MHSFNSGRRKQKQKQKHVADSYKLADAIGKNVRKSNQEKFAAETQLEKIEKNIKKLQEELNQAAGHKETAWEITLTISGSGQNEIIFFLHLLACRLRLASSLSH